MKYQAVISSHTNPVLSGVAKFNSILASKLGVTCLGVNEPLPPGAAHLLLSVKFRDLTGDEETEIATWAKDHPGTYDLFLHTFENKPCELRLVEGAKALYAANSEIVDKLAAMGKHASLGWCPALLDPSVPMEGELNFFSFGMAHKIQLSRHERLVQLLDATGADYTLWLSTAFHEKANLGDFTSVSRELSRLYGSRLRILGFLSDEAVNFFLTRADAFFAFFDQGVRSNNTSVLAAMERGCPVITNLDAYSPLWMKHGVNVLDVEKLTRDDLTPSSLKAMGERAGETVRTQASWDALLEIFNHTQIGREAWEISPNSLNDLA